MNFLKVKLKNESAKNSNYKMIIWKLKNIKKLLKNQYKNSAKKSVKNSKYNLRKKSDKK